MKRNKKTFWTLDRHHAAGFTLVELIVVIAILAILAGVGIPVYSGYITKANKGADETLVNEIKNAIMLAYYADPDAFEAAGGAGSVVLSMNADPDTDDNAFLNDALNKAFGENWANLRLKHNGWTNTHGEAIIALDNSSFSDGEGGVNQSLLTTVDKLTGTASNLLGSGISMDNFGKFDDYLTQNGIAASREPQKAANAAVVYLSQATDRSKQETMMEALTDVENWITEDGKISMGAFETLYTIEECEPFPSLAASYAVMKGFCIWADNKLGTEGAYSAAFDGISLDYYYDDTTSSEGESEKIQVQSEVQAIIAIEQGLANITKGKETEIAELFKTYLGEKGTADVKAYFSVLDSLEDNEDYILENLDDSVNFYSDRIDYLNSYLKVKFNSGDIAIVVTLNPNDVPEIGAVGMNTKD